MKRRDFLAASGGMAGALLPSWVRAADKPCPPPTLGVTGGGSMWTSCSSVAVGPAPPWFLEMRDKTWIPVAGGLPGAPGSSWSGAVWQQGARLRDVFASLTGAPSGQPTAITSAYTGGCADQVRGELILAANGGHTDYYGNEVYALGLREETPGWRRLTDPTPGTYLESAEIGRQSRGDVRGTNLDYKDPLFPERLDASGVRYGNVRAVHGWHGCCFGDGKVWYSGLTGIASGLGGQTTAVWSFDREQADELLAANAGSPISYRNAPWKYWGLAVNPYPNINLYNLEAGPAAFDRVGNAVWAFAAVSQITTGGVSGTYGFHSVNATTGAIQNYSFVNRDGAPGLGGQTPLGDPGFGGSWMAIAHDLRLAVIPQVGASKNLWLLNLDNPSAGIMRILPTFAPGAEFPGSGGNPVGNGAVYHAPSRAIFIYELRPEYGGLGARIRKLSIPANPFPSNPESSGYAWSVVDPDASNTVTPFHGGQAPAGIYGKFNIIEDMGNGQAALVVATHTLGPVFVYKIPKFGL